MDDGDENHEEEQENVDLQLQDRLIILIARTSMDQFLKSPSNYKEVAK